MRDLGTKMAISAFPVHVPVESSCRMLGDFSISIRGLNSRHVIGTHASNIFRTCWQVKVGISSLATQ